MKRYVGLLLIVLLAFSGNAQRKQGKTLLDSLLAKLPESGKDTARVRLLDNISFAYCFSNPDEGLHYADQSLALAKELGWQKGEAAANNEFGNCYRQKGAYADALDHYLKALRIDESIGNKEATGMVTLNIGTVYFSQRVYPKALEYFFLSLSKAQEIENKDVELLATGNIGSVYYQQSKFADALIYLQKALALAIAKKDKRGALNQMGNIANVYGSLGENSKALEWYFKALNFAQNEADSQMIAVNLGNIGETYLDIIRSDTNGTETAKAANLLRAIEYLERGITIARGVAFNQAIIDFSHTLSKAYALQGNYAAALKVYQQYTELKDSTFSLENNEKIAGLETARALELKDKDIKIAQLEVARKRNERWLYIGGLALMLVVAGALLRGYLRQQHSNKLISREKKRSDDLLLNILPAEVAEELKDYGSSAARHYEDVSVLFTDFVDFTGAAEHMSPEALVAELNECFTAFDAIVERNGLEKIKTIGDAYMAVCGLPIADPMHATKSVQASIEILAFVEARKSRQQSFEVRIGINSGPVVAGIVGARKFAYDIWGDTVNTAARMEQHGAPGAINISRSTYDLVHQAFHCQYRGKIDAKHKGEVEMFFVSPAQLEDALPGLESTSTLPSNPRDAVA